MSDKIDWNSEVAAIWRARQGYLRPIRQLDPISLDDLLGIERQKQALCRNSERFLAGKPANNALLWGARGTGKSSLIKALLNAYRERGLRMVEIDGDDLADLPAVVDLLRDQPHRFVIFCDDLSFEAGDTRYKPLKTVLEGSLELPPDNILLYASSNRRHLIPETMAENLQAQVVGTELHLADATEEKISLSDRFGLNLSFYPINQDEYLAIVDHYFRRWPGDRAELHRQALLFARQKGVRSGRTARQFFNHYS